MKVAELFETPLIGGRNLRRSAQDWIDSHPGDIAAILHFVDSGDQQSAEAFLGKHLRDHNLLDMVIATLFQGTPEPTY